MSDTPATQKDDFVADFHEGNEMDMSSLKDKQFVVAANTGNRNECKFLASTMRGPYDFYEMIAEAGPMYEKEAHHAKVTILSRDLDSKVQFLDSGTIEYIECHYKRIISESIFEAAVFDFTLKPGLLSDDEQKQEED